MEYATNNLVPNESVQTLVANKSFSSKLWMMLLLVTLTFLTPLDTFARGGGHSGSHSSGGTVHVSGYTRSNGTHVSGYDRPSPSQNSVKSVKHVNSVQWASPEALKVFGKPGDTVGSSKAKVSKSGAADNYRDGKGVMRDGKTGKIYRRQAAKHEFMKNNPCPSTGLTSGSCPGYAIDHIKPLYAGGSDLPHNMQFLSIDEHKEKTNADLLRYGRSK